MVPFLMIVLMLVAVFLIMLVLVQRGRGGGLAGALGGMGGQSAFGTKAGDLFTRITIVVAAVWIVCCVVVIKTLKMNETPDRLGTGVYGTGAPQDDPRPSGLPGARGPGARPGALANPDAEDGSSEGTSTSEGSPGDAGDAPAGDSSNSAPADAPAGAATPPDDAATTPDEKE